MITNRLIRRCTYIFIILSTVCIFLLRKLYGPTHVHPNNRPGSSSHRKEELRRKMDFLLEGKFIVDLNFENYPQDQKSFEELYDRYASSVEVECQRSQRLGHMKEGGWNVCLHGNFELPPYSPCHCLPPCFCKPACLVYSFGISDDWSFDDKIVSMFDCRLKAFDPSINETSGKRGDRIWFHKEGLSGSNHVTTDLNQWKMNTLKTILERLNESDAVIDYLKIDIEYWEWESLQSALDQGALNNVKQLGVEVHRDELMSQSTPLSHYRMFFRMFQALREAGFYKWFSHLNPLSMAVYSIHSENRINCCHEFVYLNLNFGDP